MTLGFPNLKQSFATAKAFAKAKPVVAPLLRSNPIGGSEPNSGCSDTKLTVMPPTWHPVSSEGVNFFFFINVKLVHSYNVKHLTCTIFCSSGLQNIYKLHKWKYSTFTIFTLFTKETKIHIH